MSINSNGANLVLSAVDAAREKMEESAISDSNKDILVQSAKEFIVKNVGFNQEIEGIVEDVQCVFSDDAFFNYVYDKFVACDRDKYYEIVKGDGRGVQYYLDAYGYNDGFFNYEESIEFAVSTIHQESIFTFSYLLVNEVGEIPTTREL